MNHTVVGRSHDYRHRAVAENFREAALARLETVEHWEEPNRKGIVYYLDPVRRPRGVLLWNIFGRVDDARQLIRSHKPVEESMLSLR